MNQDDEQTFSAPISTNIQKDLIDKYTTILFEYFAIMNSSPTVHSMEDRPRAVQIGLSAITNIYKLAFFSTKNVVASFGHCQKGIYCYIEYLEQIQKLGTSSQNLDYVDAITFIYDKTLSELHKGYLGNSTSSSSVFTNILSVSQSHQARGKELEQSKMILDQISRVCNVILWFQHPDFTLLDQMDIIDKHLPDFFTYELTDGREFEVPLCESLFLFLEPLQEKMVDVTKNDYMEILAYLSKYIKRGMKRKQSLKYSDVRDVCLYLCAHYSGQTLEQIGAQEGWKRPAEDLVKLIYTQTK
jgi:hypothetical protein